MVFILDLGDGRVTEYQVGPALSGPPKTPEQVASAVAALVSQMLANGAVHTWTNLLPFTASDLSHIVAYTMPDADAERPPSDGTWVGHAGSTVRDDSTFAELATEWRADPDMLRLRAGEVCDAIGTFQGVADGKTYTGYVTASDVFGDQRQARNVMAYMDEPDPDAKAAEFLRREWNVLCAWVSGEVYTVTAHNVRDGRETSLSGCYDNHDHLTSVATGLAEEIA